MALMILLPPVFTVLLQPAVLQTVKTFIFCCSESKF